MDIRDYGVYTNGMKKSLEDKLFFANMIDDSEYDFLLDYGCVDGALIREFKKKHPDKRCIGYDCSKEMVTMAQIYGVGVFTERFKDAVKCVDPARTVLNLSSVIHEIYSYAKSDMEIALFWKDIMCSNFKYIVIRDFCLDDTVWGKSNILDVAKIKLRCDRKQLKEFESIWGSISRNRNMVHYLMKYRYLANWDREVKENYFPISYESLKAMFSCGIYERVFSQRYILPFTYDKVKEDFGIKLKDYTHVKMILEKRY